MTLQKEKKHQIQPIRKKEQTDQPKKHEYLKCWVESKIVFLFGFWFENWSRFYSFLDLNRKILLKHVSCRITTYYFVVRITWRLTKRRNEYTMQEDLTLTVEKYLPRTITMTTDCMCRNSRNNSYETSTTFITSHNQSQNNSKNKIKTKINKRSVSILFFFLALFYHPAAFWLSFILRLNNFNLNFWANGHSHFHISHVWIGKHFLYGISRNKHAITR